MLNRSKACPSVDSKIWVLLHNTVMPLKDLLIKLHHDPPPPPSQESIVTLHFATILNKKVAF